MFFKNHIVSIYCSPELTTERGEFILPLNHREYIEKNRRLVEVIHLCQAQLKKSELPKFGNINLPN